jgi:hypothetical protein
MEGAMGWKERWGRRVHPTCILAPPGTYVTVGHSSDIPSVYHTAHNEFGKC